jgi:hypothetical protein
VQTMTIIVAARCARYLLASLATIGFGITMQ